MIIFVHDGTFEGFLCSVFHSYDMKILPDKIASEHNFQTDAFAERHLITTQTDKAERVWKAVRKKISKKGSAMVYRTFLSEYPDANTLVYNYIRYILDHETKAEFDYSNPVVGKFNKVYGKVIKEAHRVSMFARFQRTSDNLYFAAFEPEYNVLPLATAHFKDRFSDQRWVIFDLRRKYGFYYNLKDVVEIRISNARINNATGRLNEKVLSEDEKFIQKMWGSYYQSANIKERNNPKQHQQLMPKKYWKYLPEKDYLLKTKGDL